MISFSLYFIIESVVNIFPCWNNFFMQAQFAQMRPVGMPPSVGPRVPMYPPGGPGIGQQIFYGQGPPAIIPSQVISSNLSIHIDLNLLHGVIS